MAEKTSRLNVLRIALNMDGKSTGKRERDKEELDGGKPSIKGMLKRLGVESAATASTPQKRQGYGGGNLMKPRSGRTIPLYFKVSPEEKKIIEKRWRSLAFTTSGPTYGKMAVDGYAVQVDMSDFKALVSLLRNCANNLNQIAKRVNSTGNLYQEDVADLQERYRELWGAVSTLLGKLSDL